MQKILITGATGLIGPATIAQLQNHHTLSALIRSSLTTILCHHADITQLKAIEPAFDKIDTVIHLAAHIANDRLASQRAHIQGTTYIFQASLKTGARRVIFASSRPVSGSYGQLSPYKKLLGRRYDAVGNTWPMIGHQSPLPPTGLYATSKVWGEELGRCAAKARHLSVFRRRFDRLSPENRPTQKREYAVWCSHRDAVQMIEKRTAAPTDLFFDILFVNSDNKYGHHDLERARHVGGFIPEDRAKDDR